MGNYADVKDAKSGRSSTQQGETDPTKVTYIDDIYNPEVLAERQKNDPYGTGSTGSTGTSRSFRQRGSTNQKRVNTDTRVRNEANSGTAGAGGKVASGMQQSLDTGVAQQDATAQAPQIPQNAAWQATRQSVDLSSVRQRIMGGIKSNGRQ